MRQEYDFNATDKMYKYHFKRWKFRKNMTQREALKHEADAVAGRGVVLPVANGRELGSQRLKMRIHKLNSPDIFTPTQLALRTVVDHSRERLKSWDLPNYKPGNTATETWAAVACLAAYAISTKTRAEANYKALAKAATGFGTILQRQEPTLVWSTCTVIIQLFEVMPDVAIAFINVVLYFCIDQLRDSDPLRLFWVAVLRTDKNDVPRLIAQITATQIDFLRQEVGVTNTFVMKYIKSAAKYLHDHHLITPDEAHAQIHSIILALQLEMRTSGPDTSITTKNSFISASIFKACIYLDDKQWDDVLQILDSIEPEIQANNGIDPAQVVNYYEVKAEMLMERGDSGRDDYVYSERFYNIALATAQQRLYDTMPGRIGYCFLALVKYYERVENAEKLEELRAQYNEHLKRVADGEAPNTVEAQSNVHVEPVLGDKPDAFPLTEQNIRSYMSGSTNQVSDALSTATDPYSDIFSTPMDQTSDDFSSVLDHVSDVISCSMEQFSEFSLNPMENVSGVMSFLGPGQHTIEIHVQWELPDFVSQGLDNMLELATVMTITGQPDEACIKSCEDYIESTWNPNTWIIGFFRGFINSNLDFSAVTHDQTIFTSSELNVSASTSPPTFPGDSHGITFRVIAEKQHLIEICQCILWLTATFRPPESGSIRGSVASFRRVWRGNAYTFEVDTERLEPLPSPGSQSEFSYCWLNMFDGGYVLAQGFPTPSRKYGRGLELPLDIMIDQAMAFHAISHTINGQDCIILKGQYTALVPIHIEELETPGDTNEIQWHLLGKRPAFIPIKSTDQIKNEEIYSLTDLELQRPAHDLSWEDIDNCGLRIFPIGSIQEIASKRSFVGHFPKAQILVGTDREVYSELEDGPRAEPVRGTVLKFGHAMNLTLGTNAATGGLFNMSASTTIRRSRFDPVPHQARVLITDRLRHGLDKPHILYDISKRIAWMVPEACLVLHLIHYWAVLQRKFSPPNHWIGQQDSLHPGQDNPDSQPMDFVQEHVPFIEASSDAAEEASKVILREFSHPSELPNHIRFIDDDSDKLVYVRDIIRNMYLALDTLVEHQKRKKPGRFGRFMRTDHNLWGYDLADVAGFDEVPLKTFSIDKERCGGWDELTDPEHRIVVLFGNNFGELIKYEEGQLICDQWKSVPPEHDFLFADSGTLEYLQKRKDRSGRSNVFLTDRRSPPSTYGQEPCQEEEWPCCNMAFQLTSREPETIVKVERGQAVVIGKATRRGNQRNLMESMWRRNAPPEHPPEERNMPRIQIIPQCVCGPLGTCSICTEDNRLEIASRSENFSPDGAEIDLSVTSGASSSNTPQSGWA